MKPLAPEQIPFPVHSGRYEVSAAIRRFGQAHPDDPAEEGHFRVDAKLPVYLAERLRILRAGSQHSRCWAVGLSKQDRADLEACLWRVLSTAATELPDLLSLDPVQGRLHALNLTLNRSDLRLEIAGEPAAGFQHLQQPIYDWLVDQEPLDRLADWLAFAIQEDYAICRGPRLGEADDADLLEMAHICFPSSWRPAQKVGGNFAQVHGPVVHKEPLIKAHQSLVKAMINKGPFVRYAWGMHLDGQLCRNPEFSPKIPEPVDPSPEAAAALTWFRVERQTTMPMPDLNRGLFTIRTYVCPLAEIVANSPYRRERLASALRSMDGPAMKYKHLRQRREPLLRWLTMAAS